MLSSREIIGVVKSGILSCRTGSHKETLKQNRSICEFRVCGEEAVLDKLG